MRGHAYEYVGYRFKCTHILNKFNRFIVYLKINGLYTNYNRYIDHHNISTNDHRIKYIYKCIPYSVTFIDTPKYFNAIVSQLKEGLQDVNINLTGNQGY